MVETGMENNEEKRLEHNLETDGVEPLDIVLQEPVKNNAPVCTSCLYYSVTSLGSRGLVN